MSLFDWILVMITGLLQTPNIAVYSYRKVSSLFLSVIRLTYSWATSYLINFLISNSEWFFHLLWGNVLIHPCSLWYRLTLCLFFESLFFTLVSHSASPLSLSLSVLNLSHFHPPSLAVCSWFPLSLRVFFILPFPPVFCIEWSPQAVG